MDRAKACDYPQGRDESLGERRTGTEERRDRRTVEVGDERPSAKLDNNTNLLDFSLWIAVRLSTMATGGSPEQRRVYHFSYVPQHSS